MPTPPDVREARIGGAIYLAIIALGLFGEAVVRGSLVVPGNAAATMARIAEAPLLWRAGIAGDLLMQVLDVPLIVILYRMLRRVDPGLSLLAAALNIVQTSVLALNKLALVLPLLVLENSPALRALPPAELQALGYLGIKLHGYGFGIGLIFFGFTCLIQGRLFMRSGLLPRPLGLLLALAGASYLSNSFAMLLAPDVASALFPAVLVPAFIGELSVALWLLVKGVRPAGAP